MSTQSAQNDVVKGRLSRASEITIHVIGRKSGRTISLPIWFVWDAGTLYLLPVKGSETQWYKNVLKNPTMRIEAQGAEEGVKAVAITDAAQVKSVIEKFRRKYGADVKKYYSKFDVAAVVQSG